MTKKRKKVYGKYGEVAIKAVEIARSTQDPVGAWEEALHVVGATKKGCPRCAFLGLCSEGMVKGIRAGRYTRSKKNRKYALDAVSILAQHPTKAYTSRELWEEVAKDGIKHNGQMDVVLALWMNGYIKHENKIMNTPEVRTEWPDFKLPLIHISVSAPPYHGLRNQ